MTNQPVCFWLETEFVTDELCYLSIAQAGTLLKSRQLSPVELTNAFLGRIAKVDSRIHSFLLVTAEEALRQAKAAEVEISAGRYRGPMHGIPIGLKDLIETAGIRTTAHSRVLIDYVPPEDATVVSRLKERGCVILGKLGCLEFAHGSPSPDQAWPAVRNPWNPEHGFTGGSSTGSASAVAGGLVMGALGTDTGGSIRNPASFCGIAGLMPTYGRVSRRGVIPYSFSLDHCGPMAWTAQDCAIMLQAIAGHDSDDPGSANLSVPDYTADLNREIHGMRLGVIRHFYQPHLPPEDEMRRAFEAGLNELARLGAVLEDVQLRELRDYDDCKVIIAEAEFFAVHEKDLIERFEDYGSNLRFRAIPGGLIRAVDYIQAQRQRRKLAAEMQALFARYDAMATLCTYGPAPKMSMDEPTHFFQRPNLTAVFNVTGNPAISICTGFDRTGLPLAMQIIGKPFDEATILRIAHAYEQATPWRQRRPSLA
jgi:aspartyl-tRNA(Asn)/glutamyl-tRNA(Gln) amidotransferase subunit A